MECNHEYGTVDDTVNIIKLAQRGRHLDALESLYICKASKNKPVFKQQHATDTNVLFDLFTSSDKTKCNNEQVSCKDRPFIV